MCRCSVMMVCDTHTWWPLWCVCVCVSPYGLMRMCGERQLSDDLSSKLQSFNGQTTTFHMKHIIYSCRVIHGATTPTFFTVKLLLTATTPNLTSRISAVSVKFFIKHLICVHKSFGLWLKQRVTDITWFPRQQWLSLHCPRSCVVLYTCVLLDELFKRMTDVTDSEFIEMTQTKQTRSFILSRCMCVSFRNSQIFTSSQDQGHWMKMGTKCHFPVK